MKQVINIGKLLTMVVIALVSMTSCSNDDEQTETVYHQSYVQGKINNTSIAMNDLNANILEDKSMYQFKSNNQSDIPEEFDWEVKLVNTKDSLVTLYLHINDVNRTNSTIYSPNDKDQIKTKNTCYVTVTDINKNVTRVYHPTHPFPITAMWEMFMVTTGKKAEELKGVTINYTGHRWPGISGRIYGTLTSDDDTPDAMKIDINFRLY